MVGFGGGPHFFLYSQYFCDLHPTTATLELTFCYYLRYAAALLTADLLFLVALVSVAQSTYRSSCACWTDGYRSRRRVAQAATFAPISYREGATYLLRNSKQKAA